MSQLETDHEIRMATSMDAPLTKGPVARWQRKNFESSTSSVNNSLNASLHLNLTLGDSVLNVTNVPYGNRSVNNVCKTPSNTPKKSSTSGIGKTTPGCGISKLNTSQNQKKTPKTPGHGGDRFIPNRSALNVDISHYLVTTQNTCKENEVEIDNKISEALNLDLSKYRIMNCQDKAEEGTGLRVLYSSNKHSTVKKQVQRIIPSQPERILDAPDILNDYYLQLIDWSDYNILAVALNREVYLWNATTGEIDNLWQCSENEYISCVAWVEAANNLAIGTSQGDIQLWDASKKKKLRTMKGQSERVASMSWNSYLLSSGYRNGKIHHHDVRVFDHHVGTLCGHEQEVCGLAWSAGGQYLASGGNDNVVNVWPNTVSLDAKTKAVYTFNDNHSAIKALAWSPWKTNLLATGAGTADKRIRIWNVNDGSNVHTIDTEAQVCGVLWSKEYKELISAHGAPNNELILWKYPGLTKVTELTGHSSRILNIAMSPDGSTVVSVGADETIRFWDCFQIDEEKKKKSERKAYQMSNNPLRLHIR